MDTRHNFSGRDASRQRAVRGRYSFCWTRKFITSHFGNDWKLIWDTLFTMSNTIYHEPHHIPWAEPFTMSHTIYHEPHHLPWATPFTMSHTIYHEPHHLPWATPFTMSHTIYQVTVGKFHTVDPLPSLLKFSEKLPLEQKNRL